MAALLRRCGHKLAQGFAAPTPRFTASAGPARVVLQESSGVLETALLSNVRACQHELLYTFKSPLVGTRNRHSLQYSMTEHLCAVPSEGDSAFTDASSVKSSGEGIWVFMNHAFHTEATVYLRPVEHRHIDPTVGCVAVYAAKDLLPGEPLTFDYTLNEWEMSTPFKCLSTGRNVQGFKYLTEEEQQRAMPHAWPHVRQMFDEHRGLSPSVTGLRITGAGNYSWLRGTEA
uniref:SET domain-containing protein n=1 Tax=Alexandrium monilatum TaxID=311494 RepID=A0A7S4RE75_9DINO